MQRLTFTLEQWNSTKDDVGMTPIPVWIRVTSNSMMPLIRPFRDDVMVVSLRHNDLKVGDIVLYPGKFRGGDYCLHRLHRIEGDRVQTFGDGNLVPLFRLWQRLLPFRPLLLLPFRAMNKLYRITHKSASK